MKIETSILFGCVGAMLAIPVNDLLAATPKVTENLIGPWQLFVDDHLIATQKNVVRRYHQFRKHPASPMIVVDQPWENNVVNCTAVIPDEEGTGFRMYYYCWKQDKKKYPTHFMCYAVSKDGLKWDKPKLGLAEWEGSKDNNMIPNCPHAVMRTPWAQDSQKRFQGVGGMYYAYSSPDGIQWKRQSEEKIVSGGDTSHFYYDPNTKLFRCTVKGGGTDRLSGDVTGLRRRTVGYAETTDLTKFPELRMVMAPDDYDDLWCKQDTVQRTHFYACPVLPYQTMYLGFLQIYRAAEPEGYFHGPLWLELVSSRDGFHWLREEVDTSVQHPYALYETSRPPLLPLGKFRQFDDGMVIAPTPLLVGDELWIYYTGYEELHDLLPYKSAIGLATLRKDGFASLDADEVPGEIVTKRFADANGQMLVNFNSRGGSLKVEVLDADGNVIPGYGRDDCENLKGESVRQPVTWKSKKGLPAGAPVRFRFLLDHARLYSFMAGDKARPLDEPPGVCLQALYTFDGEINAWSDLLGDDGLQKLRNLGTCAIDNKKPDPAFGKHSLIVGSQWRSWNRAEIDGSSRLGRAFTLAAMVKATKKGHARLFSAYDGMSAIGTSDLVFDFDPSGRTLDGLRLFCKGISVLSDPVTFADGKYHHLAVVYDDGLVAFYLDGKPIGRQWIPGGEPVTLNRNLLVGEDAKRASDEQLDGHVDDVLVYGRALKEGEIAKLAASGAAAFFQLGR